MTARKTIQVKTVLDMANSSLASDTDQFTKRGICQMIESVLFESGQYGGFRYIDNDKLTSNGYDRQYFLKKYS